MKKYKLLQITLLIITCCISLLLTGCNNKNEVNDFIKKLNDQTLSYELTITVKKNNIDFINKLEFNNNIGYAYTIEDNEKTNEYYFENVISDDPITYRKISEEWKPISSDKDYESFFGNRFLDSKNFNTKEEYYIYNIQTAEFKIYPQDNKIVVTNTISSDTVTFVYDFTKVPLIINPLN